MTNRKLLLKLAYTVLKMKLPYIFGGQSIYIGFCCSGFVVYLCRAMGLIGYKSDLSCKRLWSWFAKCRVATADPGNFVFYGKSGEPSHVGVVLETGQHFMSFAGGDETTKTYRAAKKRNACCHIYPIDYRSDLIGFVDPWLNDRKPIHAPDI